jgi:hypothetical protein
MLISCSVYSLALKMEAIFISVTLLTFIGLHGFISKKIELFITTAVRTSDLQDFTLFGNGNGVSWFNNKGFEKNDLLIGN